MDSWSVGGFSWLGKLLLVGWLVGWVVGGWVGLASWLDI